MENEGSSRPVGHTRGDNLRRTLPGLPLCALVHLRARGQTDSCSFQAACGLQGPNRSVQRP